MYEILGIFKNYKDVKNKKLSEKSESFFITEYKMRLR